MHVSKRVLSTTLTFALSAGLGSAAAAYAGTTVSFPNTSVCHLSAGEPAKAGAQVWAWTGRYDGTSQGCNNTARVSGQLKRDVPHWGDPIDDAATQNMITGSMKVAEDCLTHGDVKYYTHVESSGGTSGDGKHSAAC